MLRKNKYIYQYVVQGKYSDYHGWEDLEEVNKHEQFKQPGIHDRLVSGFTYSRYLCKEYRIACPSGLHRIINRRVLASAY